MALGLCLARTVLLFGLLASLGGCGLFGGPSVIVPVASPAAFTDQECRAIAAQRAADSAVNGYETAMQAIVARGAYGDCMTLKQERGIIAMPARMP